MTGESLLDKTLDRTIAPGFSAIGYHLRRRTWADDDPRPGSLAGRSAVVTGAGGGLGEAAALGLARLGATVHLVVRERSRADDALVRIRAEVPEADLRVEECDVSDLLSVRRFAQVLVGRGEPIDVLVHNAGVMPSERTESADGHELTVATHVLGPVLMTELLRPVLRTSAVGARVVLVSSGGMYAQRLPVEDPDFEEGGYQGATAYARSKRMQVALAPLLQERLARDGIAVHVMHPGWADTPGVASSLPLFRLLTRPILRDAAAGADTAVWLAATEPGPFGGLFWHDREQRPTHYRSATEESAEDRDRFWAWVRETVELDVPVD